MARCHRTLQRMATGLLPHDATDRSATASALTSVKTPQCDTFGSMNHQCHGVMAGPLPSDGYNGEPLLPNDSTDLLPHLPMEVPAPYDLLIHSESLV